MVISLSFFISSLSEIGKTPPKARMSKNRSKISFSRSALLCFISISFSRIAVLQSSTFSALLYSFIKTTSAPSFLINSSRMVRFIRTSEASATPVSSSILGALAFSISPFGFQFSPSHKNSISFFNIVSFDITFYPLLLLI